MLYPSFHILDNCDFLEKTVNSPIIMNAGNIILYIHTQQMDQNTYPSVQPSQQIEKLLQPNLNPQPTSPIIKIKQKNLSFTNQSDLFPRLHQQINQQKSHFNFFGQYELSPLRQSPDTVRQFKRQRQLQMIMLRTPEKIRRLNDNSSQTRLNRFTQPLNFDSHVFLDQKIDIPTRYDKIDSSEQLSREKQKQRENQISTNRIIQEQKFKNQKQIQNKSAVQFCRCKKSKCLKLYCQCFRAGKLCKKGECVCQGCLNIQQNKKLREQTIKTLLEKNPYGFILKGNQQRGCSCSKSNCLKRYCECYQGGKICMQRICRCYNCGNKKIGNSLLKKTTNNKQEQINEFDINMKDNI